MVHIALRARSNTIYTVYATQFMLVPLIVSASKQLPNQHRRILLMWIRYRSQTNINRCNRCLIDFDARFLAIWDILTHCDLVTPYGGRDPGQHWFRQWLGAWRHQDITWTNIDLSSLRFCDVHLRAISLEISQPSVIKINLKNIFLRFYWNLPEADELIHHVRIFWKKGYIH